MSALTSHQDKMIRDFRNILDLIDRDYYRCLVDKTCPFHSTQDWDTYLLIARNFITLNFSGDKGWKMQRAVEKYIRPDHPMETFESSTTELYTLFMKIVQE